MKTKMLGALFAALLLTSFGLGCLGPTQNTATVVVDIHNSHILFSVDYRLYVDGQLERSGTLSAGYDYRYTFTHTFSGSSDTVSLYVDTVGGGFGATSDSTTVVLYPNTTVHADLTV
jgi:hypothetical protein